MNRPPQFKHYKPKRWHPEFSLIVIASISGLSNIDIGEKFGYSAQQISNILSTEQADEIRSKAKEGLENHFHATLGERINKIGEKALASIEKFVDADYLLEKSPFATVDRMMKLAVMTSKLSSDNISNINKTNIQVNGTAAFVMNPDQAIGIRNALVESSSLEAIQPGDQAVVRDIDSPLKLVKNG